MQNNFFGSKLNCVLLLILIILMVFALKFMLKDKETYLPIGKQESLEDWQKEPLDTVPGLEEVDFANHPDILGKKEDLLYFSIWPGTDLPRQVISYRGAIKGAWFFEANILINILDQNKNLLKASNAVATTDWMTAERVDFEGNIDFSLLPTGPAYFEIHNDNASGLPEFDKSIQIPIVIK